MNIKLLHSVIMAISNIQLNILIKCNITRVFKLPIFPSSATKSCEQFVLTVKYVYTIFNPISYSPCAIVTTSNTPELTKPIPGIMACYNLTGFDRTFLYRNSKGTFLDFMTIHEHWQIYFFNLLSYKTNHVGSIIVIHDLCNDRFSCLGLQFYFNFTSSSRIVISITVLCDDF